MFNRQFLAIKLRSYVKGVFLSGTYMGEVVFNGLYAKTVH